MISDGELLAFKDRRAEVRLSENSTTYGVIKKWDDAFVWIDNGDAPRYGSGLDGRPWDRAVIRGLKAIDSPIVLEGDLDEHSRVWHRFVAILDRLRMRDDVTFQVDMDRADAYIRTAQCTGLLYVWEIDFENGRSKLAWDPDFEGGDVHCELTFIEATEAAAIIAETAYEDLPSIHYTSLRP